MQKQPWQPPLLNKTPLAKVAHADFQAANKGTAPVWEAPEAVKIDITHNTRDCGNGNYGTYTNTITSNNPWGTPAGGFKYAKFREVHNPCTLNGNDGVFRTVARTFISLDS